MSSNQPEDGSNKGIGGQDSGVESTSTPVSTGTSTKKASTVRFKSVSNNLYDRNIGRRGVGGGSGEEGMMGSLLRRKKVVSLPLGDTFFFTTPNIAEDKPYTQVSSTSNLSLQLDASLDGAATNTMSRRQPSFPPPSFAKRMMHRKQVSLDLFSPEAMDFFDVHQEQEREEADDDTVDGGDDEGKGVKVTTAMMQQEEELQDIFFPLRFAPRTMMMMPSPSSGHGSDDSHPPTQPTDGSEEIQMEEGQTTPTQKGPDHHPIIKAKRLDKIKTVILILLLTAFTGVCIGWKTHSGEAYSIFGPVGLACTTPCYGSVPYQDFFFGHSSLKSGSVVHLILHLDPMESSSSLDGDGHRRELEVSETMTKSAEVPADSIIYPTLSTSSAMAKLEIIRLNEVVFSKLYDPDQKDRKTYSEKVTVDWEDPEEEHVIVVTSVDGDGETMLTEEKDVISFTLAARVQNRVAQSSVIIAALIMVAVYAMILLEFIHRTLVAIYGSLIALFFLFVMENGETESIRTIMLHQEWSTLGLLFGMMIIVGELSHTGIFEYLAVRLLLLSKGSYKILLALLGLLTAVASSFLDNVTTMLLLAPVTIDMCNILKVDPRPYLITEVILSNVGGTATLIGDPPNIIIGSSFEEVGFIDFITDILPAIYLICIPATLCLLIWIFKPYMNLTKKVELDGKMLKDTYPIYDEPRLMVAGTTTIFMILLFFLHPVHHKDTAWLALIGALLTITFTNAHDVQDALRNHVEWDTLLFFAGLFVLVEVCASMGLLAAIGGALSSLIEKQDEDKQLAVAISLLLWVSAITSAFLDNIPYTATMIPIIRILAADLPTLPIKTLAWTLSFGACLGGNGTILGSSANIVTVGIAANKGYGISFMNFFFPGMMSLVVTIGIANLYMLIVYVWA